MNRFALLLCAAVVLVWPSRADAQTPELDLEAAKKTLAEFKKQIKEPELLRAFDDLERGFEHLRKSEFEPAVACALRARGAFEKFIPIDALLGQIDGVLAITYLAAGDVARAEPRAEAFLRSARQMSESKTFKFGTLEIRADLPKKDVDLALGLALNLWGMLLERRGDYAEAEKVYREALSLWEKQFLPKDFPDGHYAITAAQANIAKVATLRGDYKTGEEYANKALNEPKPFTERGQLASFGELPAASALSTLAAIKRVRGGPGDEFLAEQLELNAANIYAKLFPAGHPHLATLTHNRATGYFIRGNFAEAKRLTAESRAQFEKTFPNGHPDLCQLVRDQGYICASDGDHAGAEKYSREALAMADRLFPPQQFPNGHPIAADCLNQLAFLVLRKPDGAAEAARYFREAARITARHTTAQSLLLSETDTLNMLRRHLPDAVSGLLTATAEGPAFDARDYQYVWASKAATARALELRQRALLARGNEKAQKLADELGVVRAELSAKLLTPVRPGAPADPTLDALTAKKEDLERRLNDALGLAAPTAPHPFELSAKLPPRAAFVDLLRYNRATGPAGVPGLTEPPTNFHYTAFVLVRGRRPERVELGAAAEIDKAVETWRRSIVSTGANERWAAGEVDRLFWSKVAAKLPPETDTIYLSPDAALNRVPFAALPGRRSEVLLEEATVAVVPHGPFLLDRLGTPPARRDKGLMLVAGGVDYGRAADGTEKPYGALAGGEAEVEALAALAAPRMEVRKLTRGEASSAKLLADLPRARVAHVATHGFFIHEQVQRDFGLSPAAFRPGPRDLRTPGARNPLVLSGLALAGANRSDHAPDTDRGLLSAEVIAGRRLAEMDLAVLSACETGLGTEVGGEGVFGLQRAFHLAGCRSVVASLWKVPDGPTRQLMTAFYQKLWAGGSDVTPARALREAQLELYRQAKSGRGPVRGPVPIAEAFPPPALPAPAPGSRFDADTFLWAAFVASGAP